MDEFDGIFSKVPRVTVEVLISCGGRGVMLALRDVDPCRGMWNLPGGSARFGEPLVEAVRRVAADELGIRVRVGPLVGYIEYPSRYENGLDLPVGLVFRAEPLDEHSREGSGSPCFPRTCAKSRRSSSSGSPRSRRAAGSWV